MPFIYRNLSLLPHEAEDSLSAQLASHLAVESSLIRNLQIVRKGVDARRKPRVKLVYTVSFSVADEILRTRLASRPDLEWQPEIVPQIQTPVVSDKKVIIVGCGPAGLFAALRLAEHGISATIIERGDPVEERSRTVQRFWKDGRLDPESNVQFGEGGAGTFSDGKLTCRSRNPLVPWVLEQLVRFGAQPEILYQSKPHIGTDRLVTVVAALRHHLLEKGFDIRFRHRMTGIETRGDQVISIEVNDGDDLPCDHLVLATGHSARDTYELLERLGAPLERKPFAMGLRVEHPQQLMDQIQYGVARYGSLPAADYAVTWNNGATGRSAYSFCMCPGGVVVAGSSEEGGVVTNGMSGQLRNSPFANSALVVNVRDEDFIGAGPLAGVRLQRHWERQAYRAGGGGYRAPAQNLLDFLKRPGKGTLNSSYRPGVVESALEEVLPEFVIRTLREGIVDFGKRLKGFITSEATLIGIESRTSAPVRILRDESFESTGLRGMYPAGEGAGYAGGIMSSAVDGVRIADMIVGRLR